MARYPVTFLLLAFTLMGCSHTRTLDFSGSGGMTPSELNKEATGKKTIIVLTDGRSIYSSSIQVAADSTSYYNPYTDLFETIPTSKIQQVNVHRTGRGALAGLGAGILSGATVGFVRALAQGDDPPSGAALSKGEKLYILPIAHAVYASLIGVPVGAVVGIQDHYNFGPRSVVSNTKPVVVSSTDLQE